MGEEGASTRLRIIDRELVSELQHIQSATNDFTDTDAVVARIQGLRDLLDARQAIVRREVVRAK